MATLERPRSPAALASDSSVAGAPTAFPVDELVALLASRPASQDVSPTPAAASASLGSREQQPSSGPRDPFADEQRSNDHSSTHQEDPHHLPPSYTDDDAPVPDYQERPSSDDAVKPGQSFPAAHDDASFPASGVSLLSEKRQQDFSNLSDAIDRLNVVAPQLHNQRVELAAGKQSELELARMVGRGRMDDQYALLAGKGKARAADGQDDAELHKIWESIEKAHGRRIDGQDSTLDLAQHGANEARRRGEYLAGLADRNDAGRLENQDWDVVQPPAAEDGDLITVDQFIHENGRASSSLAGPSRASDSPKPPSTPELKRLSGSALLGRRGSIKDGFARLVNGSAATEEVRRSRRRSASPPPPTLPSSTSAGISFVAEFQENIRVVQVSMSVPASGDYVLQVTPGDTRTAVLTPVGGSSTAASLRLALPTDVSPQKDLPVRPSSPATYSFRLPALGRPLRATTSADADAGAIAFSAESLASAAPSSLLCARCSAPLVDSSSVRPADYGALPSEHWEELIGSWLCHDEMKLDLGDEGGGGVFWPKRSEILVGGTYIMLKEALLVPQSWRPRAGGETELWQPIVCACCTAPLGRRFLQPHPTDPSSTVKLLKYAFSLPDRPPPPLPAFVAQYLLELADSHRSYHFVLEAEEREGHPRLLLWLFNTSIFVTAKQLDGAAQEGEPTRAVKILYLDLDKSRSTVDSHTTPAIPPTFPIQSAETVSYPAAVVDELAAVLAAHNGAFPPAGRQMMGLAVSWMERF